MKFLMFDFFKDWKSQKGQSLVELLIAIGLATLILPALMTGLSAGRGGRAQQEQRLEASSYLRETQEAVRSIAQRGWVNIQTNGTYHPIISNGKFVFSPGTKTTDGFLVSVVVSDTYRDSSGVIVSIPGVIDPSTKKVVTTVSWNTPYISSVNATSYYTRYKNDITSDTTLTNFNVGATNSASTGIAVTNTAGGEITLGAGGGGGDWCAPTLTLGQLDLPKSGVANAISAVEGQAYVGTGDNASGVSFANINITTDYPPVASIEGTFDGYKTNAVFGEGNYFYLASDNNSKEIDIVNLTTTPYVESGYFNAPYNQDGNGIFVVGNVGYMTTGNMFYTFDLSSKTGSRPQLDSLFITVFGQARKIWVKGNYAYVAVDGYASKELSIIDISDPRNIYEIGYADVNGAGGKEVHVNESGTRVYLATSQDSTKREFFIIDATSKNGNRPIIGSYEANGMSPKGVNVVTGNRAILVGTGAEEYQVINLANESSPVRCGGRNIDSGINGVASVLQTNGYAYSYIITGDSSSELKIILGGAGAGNNHTLTGVFESRTFDGGGEVAWNSFSATTAVPQSTTLRFRVAIKDAVNNSCAGVSFVANDFVGSDGQASSYYPSTGGQLNFENNGSGYENPGRCVRYRAYLDTSDSTQTPVIYDVNFNYSP